MEPSPSECAKALPVPNGSTPIARTVALVLIFEFMEDVRMVVLVIEDNPVSSRFVAQLPECGCGCRCRCDMSRTHTHPHSHSVHQTINPDSVSPSF
jgi:hypothetical protein